MIRTILTDATLAYMGFLVLLALRHALSPNRRRRRRTVKRIREWT